MNAAKFEKERLERAERRKVIDGIILLNRQGYHYVRGARKDKAVFRKVSTARGLASVYF